MGRGSARMWERLGLGAQQIGQSMIEALGRKESQDRYDAALARSDEDRAFDKDVTLRREGRADDQLAGIESDREYGRSRDAVADERYEANQDRSDLLAGITSGPDGLEFDPSASAAFRGEVAQRDAGIGRYHRDPLDVALATLNVQDAANRNTLGSFAIRDYQAPPAPLPPETRLMIDWAQPRLSGLTGQFAYPDIGAISQQIQAILGRGPAPAGAPDPDALARYRARAAGGM